MVRAEAAAAPFVLVGIRLQNRERKKAPASAGASTYTVRFGWFLPAASSAATAAATATAAVATTTAAAATTAAIIARSSFVHVDGAPIKLRAVQSVDRRLAFTRVRHLNESKAAGPA